MAAMAATRQSLLLTTPDEFSEERASAVTSVRIKNDLIDHDYAHISMQLTIFLDLRTIAFVIQHDK